MHLKACGSPNLAKMGLQLSTEVIVYSCGTDRYSRNIPGSRGGALPFATPLSLADHFKKHRSDFAAAATPADYEALADAFMVKAVTAILLDCKRRNGLHLRFDTSTREFSVASRSGILTYYKVSSARIRRKGGPQKYFQWECGR